MAGKTMEFTAGSWRYEYEYEFLKPQSKSHSRLALKIVRLIEHAQQRYLRSGSTFDHHQRPYTVIRSVCDNYVVGNQWLLTILLVSIQP